MKGGMLLSDVYQVGERRHLCGVQIGHRQDSDGPDGQGNHAMNGDAGNRQCHETGAEAERIIDNAH
jgi:hypothetical protein